MTDEKEETVNQYVTNDPVKTQHAELSRQIYILRKRVYDLTKALNIIASGTEDPMPPFRHMDITRAKRIAWDAVQKITC